MLPPIFISLAATICSRSCYLKFFLAVVLCSPKLHICLPRFYNSPFHPFSVLLQIPQMRDIPHGTERSRNSPNMMFLVNAARYLPLQLDRLHPN